MRTIELREIDENVSQISFLINPVGGYSEKSNLIRWSSSVNSKQDFAWNILVYYIIMLLINIIDRYNNDDTKQFYYLEDNFYLVTFISEHTNNVIMNSTFWHKMFFWLKKLNKSLEIDIFHNWVGLIITDDSLHQMTSSFCHWILLLPFKIDY